MPNSVGYYLRSRKKPAQKKKRKKILAKRPYTCDLCRYSTCFQHKMVMHIMRTHMGGKPFSCNLCSFRTSEHEDLKRHLRVGHVRTEVYECNVCDFITNQILTLQNHLKIHTEEQPYGCDQCDFKSSQQNVLLAHLETHKNDTDKCFLCDNQDATLQAFKAMRKGCRLCRSHLCACYNLTTLHLCIFCQKDTTERWSYRRTTIHLTKDSKLCYNYVNGVLTCALCARTFKAKIGYFSHMQTHLKRKKGSAYARMLHQHNGCRLS